MKLRIHWGDSYVRVAGTSIPPELKKALTYWHREFTTEPGTFRRIVTGHYRECFRTSMGIDAAGSPEEYLVTLPGFMYRVKQTLAESLHELEIIDERKPFPKPDLIAAMGGLRDYQLECAYTAIVSGGGIVACPTGWG